MRIPFVKSHGLGNDFVIIDDRSQQLDLTALAPLIADRRFGIGCDQLLILYPGSTAEQRMEIRNQDGSSAEMCGNGIRAFADYLWTRGLAPRQAIYIETAAGLIQVEPAGDLIRARLGQPRFGLAAVHGIESAWQQLTWPQDYQAQITVSMGNPHLVIFVPDSDNIDLARDGAALEKHPAFSQRINIEYVSPKPDGAFKVRVWERGVGATLACGTGAAAAGAALIQAGRAQRQVALDLPGGRLTVDWDGVGDLWLIGPSCEVATGVFDTGAAAQAKQAANR